MSRDPIVVNKAVKSVPLDSVVSLSMENISKYE
jgi:hypothetical protein